MAHKYGLWTHRSAQRVILSVFLSDSTFCGLVVFISLFPICKILRIWQPFIHPFFFPFSPSWQNFFWYNRIMLYQKCISWIFIPLDKRFLLHRDSLVKSTSASYLYLHGWTSNSSLCGWILWYFDSSQAFSGSHSPLVFSPELLPTSESLNFHILQFKWPENSPNHQALVPLA